MSQKKGTGLLMVWCEVPDEVEDEFNRWYNDEHIEGAAVDSRHSQRGALRGRDERPEASRGVRAGELSRDGIRRVYLKVRSSPTEWSQRMSPEYTATTYVRNVYEMIHPTDLTAEIESSPMAPALQIGRMDIPADVEDEWNDWYNTVYIPNYETVPGVRRGRRYTAVTGTPAYLTMYEFDHTEVSKGQEWLTQQTAHPDNARMREAMIHLPESPGRVAKDIRAGEVRIERRSQGLGA